MQLELGLKLGKNKLLHQLGHKGEVGYRAKVGQDGWIKSRFLEYWSDDGMFESSRNSTQT